ncbi:MAG: hypothetical protein OES41_08930 [Rhodospirillales bacterium]|nr:hypothetical protein [Rhodospirillales bacterium]
MAHLTCGPEGAGFPFAPTRNHGSPHGAMIQVNLGHIAGASDTHDEVLAEVEGGLPGPSKLL